MFNSENNRELSSQIHRVQKALIDKISTTGSYYQKLYKTIQDIRKNRKEKVINYKNFIENVLSDLLTQEQKEIFLSKKSINSKIKYLETFKDLPHSTLINYVIDFLKDTRLKKKQRNKLNQIHLSRFCELF